MKTVTEAQAKMLLGMVQLELESFKGSLVRAEERLKWATTDPNYTRRYPADEPEHLKESIAHYERRLVKLAALKKALS